MSLSGLKVGLVTACYKLVHSPSPVFLHSGVKQPLGLLRVIPVGHEGQGEPMKYADTYPACCPASNNSPYF